MRLLTTLLTCGLLASAQGPKYNDSGELLRPENYREWVWMTSGLGMTYGPAAALSASQQLFDNVFVEPSAWRSFRETGKWPDKTQFVLEIRYSQSEGSINNGGAFQTDIAAIEMAVKDGGWSYYDFRTRGGTAVRSAKVLPKSASCYACHSTNGAVENTFTQFYPTALEIAYAKGTVRPSLKPLAPSPAKLYHTVDTQGWDKGRAVLDEAKPNEATLNALGYQLAGAGKRAEALEVFRYVAAHYPASANATDSLAEALEASGQKAESLEASRRALDLLERDDIPEARRALLRKSIQERITRLQPKP